jgi:hypothetical protein
MKQLGLSLSYLLDKKQELESELATIHNLISCFYPSKIDSDIKKGPGRPKGSKNPDSLDSIILNALKKSKDGLAFSSIMLFVLNSGYKSMASQKVFRSMLKSRLSCLKTQGLIEKEDNDLIFKLR